MVHQHDPLDAVRRTVTRATRPALAPLRAAAATLQGPVVAHADPDPASGVTADTAVTDEPLTAEEPEELAAMRRQLTASSGAPADAPADRARRATRSASAYLDARRARLRRELRALHDGD